LKESRSLAIKRMMVENTINIQMQESKSTEVMEMIEIITGLFVRTRKPSKRRRS